MRARSSTSSCLTLSASFAAILFVGFVCLSANRILAQSAPSGETPSNSADAKNGADAKKSVWDGVYTEEQAKKGEEVYETNCEQCHADDLSGDTPYNPSPALAGKAFLLRWDSRTLNDLFSFASTNMPKNAPGSLSPDDYVNVIAFILHSNKIPAGKQPLASNPEMLKKITIGKEKLPETSSTGGASR